MASRPLLRVGLRWSFQADAVDEVKVGGEYLVGRVAAEHADEQGDDALHDERVALRREVYRAVAPVGLQPDAALAAVYEVALGLVALVERLLLVAQVDEQLVLVHPVGEVGELCYHLVLCFVDGHILSFELRILSFELSPAAIVSYEF